MRKAKIYVDPRQEKLWPQIGYDNVEVTWKEQDPWDFFGNVTLDFLNDPIPPMLRRVPVITIEDIERMAREMPSLYDYSGWPIHERRLQRELEMGQYGIQVRVPMAHINMGNWERFEYEAEESPSAVDETPHETRTNEGQEEGNEETNG